MDEGEWGNFGARGKVSRGRRRRGTSPWGPALLAAAQPGRRPVTRRAFTRRGPIKGLGPRPDAWVDGVSPTPVLGTPRIDTGGPRAEASLCKAGAGRVRRKTPFRRLVAGSGRVEVPQPSLGL